VARWWRESDVADHAGYSVWSDSEWLYVNLNRGFSSFLRGADAHRRTPVGSNAAQITRRGSLTGMLRRQVPDFGANCVTHAQVSVNPRNQRIGYHTGLGGEFPYAGIGAYGQLPEPTAALWRSILYDPAYVNSTGSRLGKGDARRRPTEARGHGAGPWRREHRNTLRRKYKTILAALVKPGRG